MLLGRDDELALLRARLDDVRDGRGFALLVDGEPGIGKTALLGELGRAADGVAVLRVDGAESETQLPFAALRNLSEPLLRLRDELTPAQAAALSSALALSPPAAHDRFAVFAALLALLRHCDDPVLVLVDDLQWVDDASRQAILYTARRAAGTQVGFVLAARAGSMPDAEGLQRLTLGGLDDHASGALLRTHAAGLDPGVAARLVRSAAGNPLALRELPRLINDEQRAGRQPLGIAPHPGEQIAAAFDRQLSELSRDERRALVVAAAMDRGPAAWLADALAQLDLEERALDAAERRALLTVAEGTVRFDHALLRAAAYHAGDGAERRSAHRALAATTADPRRRAWHLAASVDDVDPDVAGALADVAVSARAVGGHAEAAEAFARAAELSPAGRPRARLQLEAARELAVVGAAERALALVDRAAGALDPTDAALALGLRGHLRLRGGDPAGAQRVLDAEAEKLLEAGDAEAAARLLLDAVVALTMTGDRVLLERAVGQLQVAAAQAGGVIALLSDVTLAQYDVARGATAEGRRRLDGVIAQLAGVDPVAFAEPLALTGQCLLWLAEAARAHALADGVVSALEGVSALGRLPYPLCVRAQAALWRGDVAAAVADIATAARLARDTGQDTMLTFILAMQARVTAIAGQTEEARALAARALQLCDRSGAHGHAAYAHAALGHVELVEGRPEAAIAPLQRAQALAEAAGFANPALTASAGDLVDALLAAGRADEARDRTDALVALDADGWTGAITARAAVATSTDGDALAALQAAARAAADALDAPLEVARTELAVGQQAIRLRRRGTARVALERAQELFHRLGARAWEARAHDLLAAQGEVRSELAELPDEERRLAVLVSRGMTNEEIGRTISVSTKTVERRLSLLYRKLDIGSRTALARLVTQSRANG